VDFPDSGDGGGFEVGSARKANALMQAKGAIGSLAHDIGAGIRSGAGAVAGATQRVKVVTSEKVAALRDDVTAVTDAAARVLRRGQGRAPIPRTLLEVTFCDDAELIRPTRVTMGRIYVTPTAVEWVPRSAEENRSALKGAVEPDTRPRRIALDEIVAIYPRRFLLRRRALELFLSNGKSYLFHLPELAEFPEGEPRAAAGGGGRGKAPSHSELLHRAVLAQRPPRLLASPLFAQPLTPRQLVRRAKWTAKWQAGEMSNYEYLMLLNTAAGRSFADMQQYPVMPWIVADYESPELDLDNPNSFRDLSKPIGALTPARLQQFVERCAYPHMRAGTRVC
jgi:hypothetical protein